MSILRGRVSLHQSEGFTAPSPSRRQNYCSPESVGLPLVTVVHDQSAVTHQDTKLLKTPMSLLLQTRSCRVYHGELLYPLFLSLFRNSGHHAYAILIILAPIPSSFFCMEICMGQMYGDFVWGKCRGPELHRKICAPYGTVWGCTKKDWACDMGK